MLTHEVATDETLVALGAPQHGAFSLQQALDRGVSSAAVKYRCRTNQLRRIHNGVYAHAASPATWEQALMAATLAVPRSAVSGLPAAALHGLKLGVRGVEVTAAGSCRRRTGLSIRRVRSLGVV